jgi:hypothetical protein
LSGDCFIEFTKVIFPVPLKAVVENISRRTFPGAIYPVTFLDTMTVWSASFSTADEFPGIAFLPLKVCICLPGDLIPYCLFRLPELISFIL